MRSLLALSFALAAACGGESKHKQDAGAQVDAEGGPDASCFENPTTHYEIINACTPVQKIYKTSNPPLLGSDGTLPPLP